MIICFHCLPRWRHVHHVRRGSWGFLLNSLALRNALDRSADEDSERDRECVRIASLFRDYSRELLRESGRFNSCFQAYPKHRLRVSAQLFHGILRRLRRRAVYRQFCFMRWYSRRVRVRISLLRGSCGTQRYARVCCLLRLERRCLHRIFIKIATFQADCWGLQSCLGRV